MKIKNQFWQMFVLGFCLAVVPAYARAGSADDALRVAGALTQAAQGNAGGAVNQVLPGGNVCVARNTNAYYGGTYAGVSQYAGLWSSRYAKAGGNIGVNAGVNSGGNLVLTPAASVQTGVPYISNTTSFQLPGLQTKKSGK